MFRFIKQVYITLLSFSRSLASMANVANFSTCMSLIDQPCMTRPSPIDLNLDEYNHQLHYYSFMVNLYRRNRSYTLDDPSGKICSPNKTEHANLNVF